jgi:hypothetical protein
MDNLDGPASAGIDGNTCFADLTLGAGAKTGFLGGGEYRVASWTALSVLVSIEISCQVVSATDLL